jgi:hypothetical protein
MNCLLNPKIRLPGFRSSTYLKKRHRDSGIYFELKFNLLLGVGNAA